MNAANLFFFNFSSLKEYSAAMNIQSFLALLKQEIIKFTTKLF